MTVDSAKLREQAQAALARWDAAVAAAGGPSAFVQVGEPTGQVGDWEVDLGDNNKRALMAGLVEAAGSSSAETPPDGQVQWQDGTDQAVRLISAQQALAGLKPDTEAPCTDCAPLRVTGAQLTTGTIMTSRGPATGPLWEFTVRGTAVRVTRAAIAGGITVVPPPSNPGDAPVGISISSATAAIGARQLTVSFIGAPAPGDQACGADYTGESVESSTAVVVIVTEHAHNGLLGGCTAVGAERTATVELTAPLGDRAVLDLQRGLPVSVIVTR